MNKFIDRNALIELVKDNSVVAIGGFLAVGTPESIIDILVDAGIRDLTVIANDTAFQDKGIGKLVVNGQLRKVITSHIGTNPESGRQMNNGKLEVELIPQGTLAERLRCGGAGLGGVLTRTGVGTIVAENKEVLEVDGIKYLLETALHADIALIKAAKADQNGNLICRRAAINFNPVMAMAADLVIAEVEQVVEIGDIDPDDVTIPGMLVDYLFMPERSEASGA